VKARDLVSHLVATADFLLGIILVSLLPTCSPTGIESLNTMDLCCWALNARH
jgi:hypothetical protein